MSRLLVTTVGVACLTMQAGCDPAGNAQSPDRSALTDATSAVDDAPSQPPAAQAATDPAATDPAATDPAATDQAPTGDQQAAEPTDPDRLVDKTFDDLAFDIEPDAPYSRDMLTDPIEALDGQRLRIRGYILPTAQKRGIKQFVLVRDNQECCFGPGAALYDCILVSMQPGASTEFSIRPISVSGRLSIEEFPGPDGKPLAIYQLEGEAVD